MLSVLITAVEGYTEVLYIADDHSIDLWQLGKTIDLLRSIIFNARIVFQSKPSSVHVSFPGGVIMHWAKVLIHRPGYRSERARAQAVGPISAMCPRMDHREKWHGIKPMRPDMPFGPSCTLVRTSLAICSTARKV